MIPASVRFDVFEVFWHFPLVIFVGANTPIKARRVAGWPRLR
jgi:hypothetical protein